jgi:hypothetical protein
MEDIFILLGVLAIMMSPMVFGAIALIYSAKVTQDIGREIDIDDEG